ncbi:receptor-type tyrosine-protein phosphatase alpha-like [Haliotis asinina]|uniref:receptor-type tyrosine-protein phosphatase alpha-like n=1 Tax=Haliotis asinina TaxID=109174 RepID=UPI003531920C
MDYRIVLVFLASLSVADGTCHCNTASACNTFPSAPCSQVVGADSCQEGWFGQYCQKRNIALGSPTDQSSTYNEGFTYFSSNLGVDGNTNTNFYGLPFTCTHTRNDQPSIWTVYLNTSHTDQVQHMRLYLRSNQLARNRGMQIFMDNQLCFSWDSFSFPREREDVICSQPLTGRTVAVQIPSGFLTLCEVQIFVCSDGWFAGDCDKQCNCLDTTEVCDKITGECPSGCALGFNGTDCLSPCPDGTYGFNCTSVCGNCLGGGVCDRTTGACPGGCSAGWEDYRCIRPCRDGSYGVNCSTRCGQCRDGEGCDRMTGTCPRGCAAGWINDSTCLQECPDATHGFNCSSVCGNCLDGDVCNKTTGACPRGCNAGWMADACSQKENTPDNSVAAAAAGGAVAAVLVVAVLVVVIILWRRRGQKKHDRPVQSLEQLVDMKDTEGHTRTNGAGVTATPGKYDMGRTNAELPSVYEAEAEDEDEDAMYSVEGDVDVDNDADATYYNWVPPHMPLDKLQQCINEKRKKASFETEFKAIPYGVRRPHKVGKKPENKRKNRFIHLYPYDDTRVVLSGDEDYINANHIMGHNETRKYIATQGPRPVTVTDFWRMVWQEKVEQIVMLTRLMEMNKKKCEHYWPDVNQHQTHGTIKVTNKAVISRADYSISTFLVTQATEERTVTHYHFTSWPDHGVPSPPALVNFWRLVKQQNKVPMVVHCSAGVGRTGAFIALDYLMDEAEADHNVNVFMCVSRMRQSRMNMVQTVSQYEFVHDVVLEAISSLGTQYTSSEFDQTFGTENSFSPQQEAILRKQFQLLRELASPLPENETSHALLPENSAKNRSRDILPGNRSRPFLCTPVKKRNDYINAVFVPCFSQPSTMIVSQTPLPGTVVDFWRLVYDHDLFTIVCLDDSKETVGIYPAEAKGFKTGPFSVTHVDNSSHKDYIERHLSLNHNHENRTQPVIVFSLCSMDTLSNAASLLELVNKVGTVIRSSDHKVLVHCRDGASVSGVFCSVLNIISRLRLDGDVDIFLTIRELHRVRPQFIQSFDEFKLCYEVVKEYQRPCNIYENL